MRYPPTAGCSPREPLGSSNRWSSSDAASCNEYWTRSPRNLVEITKPSSGLARLTAIFQDCLVENIADRVRARRWRGAFQSAALLARENPLRLPAALMSAARTRHH